MRRYVAAVLAVALLPGCTVGVKRAKHPATPTATVTGSPPACRTTYLPPDPKRPVIRLEFAVDDAHRTVTGTEHVVFTPDRPVTELVFRLWLNGERPAVHAARIDVTKASLPMRYQRGGGDPRTPGTVLRLALPAQAPAGRAIAADLSYSFVLPEADVDRWGHTRRTAWWASAHPLLAWVRGSGWVTDDAVGLLGETAVSEVADYDVKVTAPADDEVYGNAFTEQPTAPKNGRRTWHSRNDRARDVGVVVGPFTQRDTSVDGVPVRVAVSQELGRPSAQVLGPVEMNAAAALTAFTSLFGPYPFDDLTIVAIGAVKSAGVEYPGLVFVGDQRYDVVVPHEVAHQWFYALVGNNQARDPWLDESFATFAEVEVNTDLGGGFLDGLDQDGDVGAPMSYWDKHRKAYGGVVYAKGAGALLFASQSGPALFGALLRCYVHEHAWTVATPQDLATDLAPMPAAIKVLRDAGALK